MSQYIHITAKSKKDSNTTICLGWWGTSIARDEDMYEVFPYTCNDMPITYEQFKENVRCIEKALERKQEDITKTNSEKHDIVVLLQGCKESEAAKVLLERIDNLNYILDEDKEDYEEWANIVTTLNIILNIYEDNKDKWDIYYSNC